MGGSDVPTNETPLLGNAKQDASNPEMTKNQLGTLRGVYVPCVLSIFGVVLFLRMGWAVGNIGLIQTVVIMAVACVVDMLTILSVSALATNGQIGSGGPYYLISRTLGPAFGGSAGVVFFLANAIGVTFYLEGFVETAISSFRLDFASCYWMEFAVGSIVLATVTAIALVGAKFYSSIASVILVVKMVSITLGFLGFVLRDPLDVNIEGFTGISMDTFIDNLHPNPGIFTNYTGEGAKCGVAEGGDLGHEHVASFFTAFGVLFPAFTGIMAGANMSGDLKNPGRSISKGSMLGVWTAMLVYACILLSQAFTVQQPLLAVDSSIMQEVSWAWWLVAAGIFCSTFASAMSSIVGASRILQAMGRDRILPVLRVFGQGSVKGNEPRVAIMATWFIAQLGLLLGNLNTVAPILSMCFLLTYGIVNAAVFVLAVSGTPNFRPLFGYFSWHTAILGTLLSVSVMFLLDAVAACTSVMFMLITFLVVSYFGPDTDWGEISQAIIYHQVRKYLLMLDRRKEHIKYWRPQLLTLVNDPENEDMNLVLFGNEIKKGGLYVLGCVVLAALDDDSANQQAIGQRQRAITLEWMRAADSLRVKAFVEVVASSNVREGVFALLQAAGLGGMNPNTLLLKFPESCLSQAMEGDMHNCMYAIRDGSDLGKNVVLARGFNRLDRDSLQNPSSGPKASHITIDVWPVECWGDRDHVNSWQQAALLLQLAYIFHSTPFWRYRSTLRVCSFVLSDEDIEDEECRLVGLLTELRIKAEIHVSSLKGGHGRSRNASSASSPMRSPLLTHPPVVFPPTLPGSNRARSINQLLRRVSASSAVVLIPMPLPLPRCKADHVSYFNDMDIMSAGLPPTAIVLSEQMVVTTDF